MTRVLPRAAVPAVVSSALWFRVSRTISPPPSTISGVFSPCPMISVATPSTLLTIFGPSTVSRPISSRRCICLIAAPIVVSSVYRALPSSIAVSISVSVAPLLKTNNNKLTSILEVLCRFGALTSGLLDHERLRWLLLSSCRLLSCRGSPSLRLRLEDEYELPAGDGERASPWRAIRAGCR